MRKCIFVLVIFILTFYSCSTNIPKDLQTNNAILANIFQLKELNTNQIGSIDKGKTVVLIPGGILEEHGPYLPSFTDGYWNEKLTDTIAKVITKKKDWNVLIFPTIPLGNSGANDVGMKYSFPGTYTVRFETLRAIFMDIATELGEQGFKNIFIIHGHGAPNHQRALDQTSDYFNETYGGKMVNLMGLNPIMLNWFDAPKTAQQQKEDGFTIHAGMAETSSMLYLVPHLVDSSYKQATPFTGNTLEELIQIGKSPQWKGYFGSQRIATLQYGQDAWKRNSKMFTQYVLDILDNKINLDTVVRFGDYSKGSKIDVLLDSLSLQEEQSRKAKQQSWLQKKGMK
ncbi:MAG TPA: creatininase family protein [Chitinophagaceae bacterium]|jgi:creatinine amidohydrolase/Fe(II)-dependent formamide hydrolase-like protein|nr:creatininase family protein [Chitinophagaceae bacterium]